MNTLKMTALAVSFALGAQMVAPIAATAAEAPGEVKISKKAFFMGDFKRVRAARRALLDAQKKNDPAALAAARAQVEQLNQEVQAKADKVKQAKGMLGKAKAGVDLVAPSKMTKAVIVGGALAGGAMVAGPALAVGGKMATLIGAKMASGSMAMDMTGAALISHGSAALSSASAGLSAAGTSIGTFVTTTVPGALAAHATATTIGASAVSASTATVATNLIMNRKAAPEAAPAEGEPAKTGFLSKLKGLFVKKTESTTETASAEIAPPVAAPASEAPAPEEKSGFWSGLGKVMAGTHDSSGQPIEAKEPVKYSENGFVKAMQKTWHGIRDFTTAAVMRTLRSVAYLGKGTGKALYTYTGTEWVVSKFKGEKTDVESADPSTDVADGTPPAAPKTVDADHPTLSRDAQDFSQRSFLKLRKGAEERAAVSMHNQDQKTIDRLDKNDVAFAKAKTDEQRAKLDAEYKAERAKLDANIQKRFDAASFKDLFAEMIPEGKDKSVDLRRTSDAVDPRSGQVNPVYTALFHDALAKNGIDGDYTQAQLVVGKNGRGFVLATRDGITGIWSKNAKDYRRADARSTDAHFVPMLDVDASVFGGVFYAKPRYSKAEEGQDSGTWHWHFTRENVIESDQEGWDAIEARAAQFEQNAKDAREALQKRNAAVAR